MASKVFVGNLPYSTDQQSLKKFFVDGGWTVLDARVVIARDTGKSRGFGFVELEDAEAVKKAITQLDGAELDGRRISIREAHERARGPRPGGGGGGYGGGGGGGYGGGGGGGYGGGGGGGGYGGGGGGGYGGGGRGGPPSGDRGRPAFQGRGAPPGGGRGGESRGKDGGRGKKRGRGEDRRQDNWEDRRGRKGWADDY